MKIKISVLALLFSCFIYAQTVEQMQVVSFGEETGANVALAAINQRLDNNDEPCALVLVEVLSESPIEFNSSLIIGPVDEKTNIYEVYLAAGAKSLEIKHPRFPTLNVIFEEAAGIKRLKSKTTYRLVISVPETGETFEDKLNAARELYNTRGTYTAADQYRKAVNLYEAAYKHTDCPADMLQTIKEEMDVMKFLRLQTYRYELASNIASDKEKIEGIASDSVYIYRMRAYKCARKLVEAYPDNALFKQMRDNAYKEVTRLPKGQVKESKEVQKQRTIVYGTVKSQHPLNSIGIYAAQKEKPKKEDKKALGNVKPDGTYKVYMPDGYSYLCFDFDKKSHHIDTKQESVKLDIEIE